MNFSIQTPAATKLLNGAVTSDSISNLAVTTGKLADLAVTTGKLVDDSVDINKINWTSLGVAQTSTSKLEDVGDDINQSGKFSGKIVLNSTNNKLYVSQGGLADSNWNPMDGSAAITPE